MRFLEVFAKKTEIFKRVYPQVGKKLERLFPHIYAESVF
jgi:hypothetical protein